MELACNNSGLGAFLCVFFKVDGQLTSPCIKVYHFVLKIFMRLYFFLIILVTSMAFLMGYVSLNIENNMSGFEGSSQQVAQLHQEFERQVVPRHVVDFKNLYYLPQQIKLLNPFYTISSFQSFFKKSKSGLPVCQKQLGEGPFSRLNKKEVLWNSYICQKIPRLPFEFFITAPFMHSSGFSYAFLAYQTRKPIFFNSKWIRNNIPLFHVQELKKLDYDVKRKAGYYGILVEADNRSLIDLLRSEANFLSNDLYFVRANGEGSGMYYRIYERRHFEAFLKRTRYSVGPWTRLKSCSVRLSQVCWNYRSTALSKIVGQFSSYLFYLLLLVLLVIIIIILNKIRSDKSEDENRKMALRVLTHEFRTPVASLMLQMENLDRLGLDIPLSLIEQHLKIKDNIYRLKRLTEMSQKYLTAGAGGRNKFVFNKTEVPSCNDFFGSFVEEYSENSVVFQGLGTDTSFNLDPYWIGICLKNLIENSIKHGKPETVVGLKIKGRNLLISVRDQGDSSDLDFKSLKNPFVKGKKSKGMGLGLNIVANVVKSMGGDFRFRSNPTEFTIKIKSE